jgi:putative endonuclease
LPTPSAIGRYGENVAASFLRRHGYRVLCRNFAVEEGEIDLVCRHGEVLVFVEVRTRAGHAFGRPIETIDARKEDALRAAAEAYLRLLEKRDIYHRFDAVEVTWREGERPVCVLSAHIFA